MEDINKVEETKDAKGRRKSVTKEEMQEMLDIYDKQIRDYIQQEFNYMEMRIYRGLSKHMFDLMDKVNKINNKESK